ncbi:MAG: nucleotidyltransferase family protein [Candidatus Hydrogenedentota bacterium]
MKELRFLFEDKIIDTNINDLPCIGYLIRRLKSKNIQLSDDLNKIEKRITAFNLLLISELNKLKDIAINNNLLFIPIKGPLLSLLLYNDLLRETSDIDIYTARDYDKWQKILLQLGYKTKPRYPETFSRDFITIDLHPSFINYTRVPSRKQFSQYFDTIINHHLVEISGFKIADKTFYLQYLPSHNLFHHCFTSVKEHLDLYYLSQQLPIPSVENNFVREVIDFNLYFIKNYWGLNLSCSNRFKFKLLLHLFLTPPVIKNRYPLSLFFIRGLINKLKYLNEIIIPTKEFLYYEYPKKNYLSSLFTHWYKNVVFDNRIH